MGGVTTFNESFFRFARHIFLLPITFIQFKYTLKIYKGMQNSVIFLKFQPYFRLIS